MKYKILFLCCLSGILLSACNVTIREATPTLFPSATEIAILSATPTLTQTSRPTHTAIPPTPTSFLVPTPLPKLSQTDSLARVLGLLRSNGNCALPCWWGIVPGETDMPFAMNYLLSFSTYDKINFPPGKITAEFLYKVPKSVSPIELTRVKLTSQSTTVDQIIVSDLNSWKYQIPNLLQTHGIPTSIWMYTFRSDYGLPENTVPFSIALFYQDKGILAMYGNLQGRNMGAKIRGCIIESPILFLWSYSQELSFANISQWEEDGLFYLSLEDASNLSIENFYNEFKDGDNIICIDTPADLWPDQ
jgi:hypothetical protein